MADKQEGLEQACLSTIIISSMLFITRDTGDNSGLLHLCLGRAQYYIQKIVQVE